MLKSRVLEFCKYRNIAISRFEKECGLSNGYFNKVKNRPSLDKLHNISEAFPLLNTDWLLTGEGEMLRDVPMESPAEQLMRSDEVGMLLDRLQAQAEEIGRLKERLECLQKSVGDVRCDARVG
jgi:transcriptional regulator with XRE-family HTH domain